MTRVLLHRMLVTDRSQEYFHELARDLAGGRQERSFREELWDYVGLYDNLSGLAPDPAKFVQDDLTDWIFTFQSNDAWKKELFLPF